LDGTTPSLSMNMRARVWSQTTYMLSNGLICLMKSSEFMPSLAAVSALNARTSAAVSIFMEPATLEYSASTRSSTDVPDILFSSSSTSPNTASYDEGVPCEIQVRRSRP
jgi:hypothetical protein